MNRLGRILSFLTWITVIDIFTGSHIEDYLLSIGVNPLTIFIFFIIIIIFNILRLTVALSPIPTGSINGTPATEILEFSRKLVETPQK